MWSLTFMISISFCCWWFSSKSNLQSISPPLCSPEPRRFHRDGNRFRQPSSFAAPPRHFLTPTHQPNVIHLCLLPPPWFARTSNRRCPHLIYDVPCHRSTTTTPKDPPAGLELADPQLHQWIHKQVDPNLISMVCYQALWWYCYLVCFYPLWIQNLFSLWIRNHLCASSSSCEFCSCSCTAAADFWFVVGCRCHSQDIMHWVIVFYFATVSSIHPRVVILL